MSSRKRQVKTKKIRKKRVQTMKDIANILEVIMLLCFGASWPINLHKAVKARTAKGTSLPFFLLIELGYLCGIMAKVISDNINKNGNKMSSAQFKRYMHILGGMVTGMF